MSRSACRREKKRQDERVVGDACVRVKCTSDITRIICSSYALLESAGHSEYCAVCNSLYYNNNY